MTEFLKKRLQQHLRLAILLYLSDRPAEATRRFAILRILSQAPAYTANASIIEDCLMDMGQSVLRDQIHGDFTWLHEQGLVHLSTSDCVYGVQMMKRGLEIAEGKASYPGLISLSDTAGVKENLAKISLVPSDNELLEELLWLVAQNLISTCLLNDAFIVTEAGRDVAQGRKIVDGIKKPSPDTIMRTAAAMIKGAL